MRRSSLITLLTIILFFAMTSVAQSDECGRRDRHKTAQGISEYLNVADYGIRGDGKTDVTDTLQRLILSSPNRTLFFPDGTYLLSHPLMTPADPRRSVSLRLSDFAVLKASGKWKIGEAVVRLGAVYKANNINLNGSNYGFYGGIIDGSGMADGISIDGGRETKISNVSVKHTRIGIHIMHGANSGSSDADVSDVNIVGTSDSNAVGVLVEGYDNTFTNMRIASVHIGVWIKSGGNSLRNIHPLYIFSPSQVYDTSCGFLVEASNNWFSFCYSDQFATGFRLRHSVSVNLTDCFCFWYTGKVLSQTAIECEGKYNTICSGLRTGFSPECKELSLLRAEKDGRGMLVNMIMPDAKLSEKDVSRDYMR